MRIGNPPAEDVAKWRIADYYLRLGAAARAVLNAANLLGLKRSAICVQPELEILLILCFFLLTHPGGE